MEKIGNIISTNRNMELTTQTYDGIQTSSLLYYERLIWEKQTISKRLSNDDNQMNIRIRL